jgi:hypothetical protein
VVFNAKAFVFEASGRLLACGWQRGHALLLLVLRGLQVLQLSLHLFEAIEGAFVRT